MTPTLYWNFLTKNFQFGSLVMELVNRVYSMWVMLVNYNSNVKLNKYRHNLYLKQLERMEGFLSQSSPYTFRGDRMDRRF